MQIVGIGLPDIACYFMFLPVAISGMLGDHLIQFMSYQITSVAIGWLKTLHSQGACPHCDCPIALPCFGILQCILGQMQATTRHFLKQGKAAV